MPEELFTRLRTSCQGLIMCFEPLPCISRLCTSSWSSLMLRSLDREDPISSSGMCHHNHCSLITRTIALIVTWSNGILGPGVFNINELLDRHVLKLPLHYGTWHEKLCWKRPQILVLCVCYPSVKAWVGFCSVMGGHIAACNLSLHRLGISKNIICAPPPCVLFLWQCKWRAPYIR